MEILKKVFDLVLKNKGKGSIIEYIDECPIEDKDMWTKACVLYGELTMLELEFKFIPKLTLLVDGSYEWYGGMCTIKTPPKQAADVARFMEIMNKRNELVIAYLPVVKVQEVQVEIEVEMNVSFDMENPVWRIPYKYPLQIKEVLESIGFVDYHDFVPIREFESELQVQKLEIGLKGGTRNKKRRFKRGGGRRGIPRDNRRIRAKQLRVPERVLQTVIKGDPYFAVVESGTVTLKTNTVTTGVLASGDAFSLSDLLSFASKYGTIFSEYLIWKWKYIVTPVVVTTGSTKFYFDYSGNSTPTLNQSQSAWPFKDIPHSNSNPRKYSIVYENHEYVELSWAGTSGSPAPVFPSGTWCLYTNNANYGAPIVATPLYTVQFKVWVVFRGKTG